MIKSLKCSIFVKVEALTNFIRMESTIDGRFSKTF